MTRNSEKRLTKRELNGFCKIISNSACFHQTYAYFDKLQFACFSQTYAFDELWCKQVTKKINKLFVGTYRINEAKPEQSTNTTFVNQMTRMWCALNAI